MLLSLALSVHGVKNGLSLGRVLAVQLFDVFLHFHVNATQSLLQVLETEEL